MTRDEFLKKKGMLVETGLTHDEIAVKMIRTDGGVLCEECGKTHREHPYIHEARDWNDDPYLHLLCDGTVVKL